uniref:Uncharacterized protein n=1 Tax=Apteryx owenii TaxID=8824 RepID=A0A8B9PTL5_APTOW
MRWPGVPLCGLLWMWLPLSCGRPVKIDKVKADTKNLARTLIARIQELQARAAGRDPRVSPLSPRPLHEVPRALISNLQSTWGTEGRRSTLALSPWALGVQGSPGPMEMGPLAPPRGLPPPPIALSPGAPTAQLYLHGHGDLLALSSQAPGHHPSPPPQL